MQKALLLPYADRPLSLYSVEKVIEQHPVAAITAKTNLLNKKFYPLEWN
jgi:hypothetical protein